MNVFCFTGNLGKDCRTGLAGSSTVCNFPVAVKSGFGQNEQTIWVDCALWGARAEGRLPDHLVKGQQVAVSGELGTREHEGKTYLTCRVSDVTLVGGKPGGQQAPAQQPQPQAQAQAQAPAGGFDDFDDDK